MEKSFLDLPLFGPWNILDYLGNLKLSEEIIIGTKLKLLTCTFIFKHKIYKSAYFEPCFLMSKFGEHFLDFQENHQTSTLKNRLLTLINAGPTYSEAKYKSLALIWYQSCLWQTVATVSNLHFRYRRTSNFAENRCFFAEKNLFVFGIS